MSKSIFILQIGFFLSIFSSKIFCQTNHPFAELDSIRHVCEDSLGYVKFHLNGDPDSYTYYWLHGPVSLELDSLLPGDYTLVVIDFYGCVEVYDITIEDLSGCFLNYQIVNGRVECIAEIRIRVYSSGSGLPIDESALLVKWEDGDTSGLIRTVSLKESKWYCVHIEPLSSNDSCCVIDTCIFVHYNPKCKFAIQKTRLIVNEMNRRGNGDGQYVELLVVGNGECGDSLDLRGFRLDDNNGYLIPGNSFVNVFNPGMIGINPGFLAFSYSPTWTAVPNGSLIVIYDEIGRKEEGLPEDDPNDTNQDGVYVLSANNSQYLLGFTSGWDESQTEWTYTGSFQPPSWSLVEISPYADGMQTRYPDGYFDHGQSLGQTPFSAPNNFEIWITDASSSSCNCQFIKEDPFLKEDFECTLAEDSLQTPGLPNSEENAAHIDSLRNCQRRPISFGAPPGKTPKEKGLVQSKREGPEDLIYAYPNPYSRRISLKIHSAMSGQANLKVYSATGQLQILSSTFCEAGDMTIELEEVEILAPGIHILQFDFPSGNTGHLRIVKVR